MSRRRKVIIHKHPAPPAAPPASPKPAPWDPLPWLTRMLTVAVFCAGLYMLASPWLPPDVGGRWLHESGNPWRHEASMGRLPAPGVICWRLERSTSAGTTRERGCTAEPGWHWENRPDEAGMHKVAVPDGISPYYRRRWAD